MNAARWRQVEAVLDATLDSDPSSWPAILDERCGHDPDLRREVEALLDRYHSARQFLDSPPLHAATELIGAREAPREAGTRIGPYRIVRQIGQGGMARVYLAERDDGQFRQRVALKLLRAEHDSDIDQGRFRAERQILASLNHPHIARLLDGGVTDAGLPYLVMELVEGEPIDSAVRVRELSVRQRLDLFLTVLDAVQHAHRNLVVHRDLKPSNIFVTGDHQVKLLDFGLAKLLEPSLAAAPRTTQRWMTPEYAAPEQVRGEPATTLTDVYQLGGVLYELLAGRLPFGTRTASPYALEQAILEQDPPPPSQELPELRGDLDAIVLKALAKEPEQRYDSAQAFAADVRRHLSGHPVLARRQTWQYQTRRFVRRHRMAVAAAVAGVVLVGAYAVTVTVQRERTAAALAQASTEAQKATKVTELMLGLFEQSEGGRAFSDTATARALLDRSATRARLTAQPIVQAEMLEVIGHVYVQLGEYEQARAMFEEVLAIRRAAQGTGHVDVAATLASLADAMRLRGDAAAAVPLHREALESRRAALGPTHTLTLSSLYLLGLTLHEARDMPASRAIHDEWIAGVLAQPAETTEARATTLRNLATMLQFRGQRDEIVRLNREVVAIRLALLGPRHPEYGEALHTLGSALRAMGQLEESEVRLQEAVAVLRAADPGGSLETAAALNSLSRTLQRARRQQEALAVQLESCDLFRRFHGTNHAITANCWENAGGVYRDLGHLDSAEATLRASVRMYEASAGDGSLQTMRARIGLGDVLRSSGKLAEAEPLLLRGYEAYTQRSMPNPGFNPKGLALESLVKLYEAQGREREAARYRALLAADSSATPTGSRSPRE